MSEEYAGRQVVGMDLHRHRSVLVRMSEDGRKLGTARITNSPAALRAELARAGENPRVVLEATYGWYWAADTLAAAGAEVHLAHPLGVKAYGYRRVKTDARDAANLADLLRMGRLPEAWITPREVRDLRELTRYRQKLVGLRSNCKDQVHAVLAKLGIAVTCSDLFGAWGSAWLDGLRLPQPYAGKVTSLRQQVGELTTEITMLSEVLADLLAGHRGYLVIQRLPGIGPVLAAVIIAEIGDVTRFRTPGQLASWSGLTPGHRESDIKVTRGHVTKQGSRLLRWALIEAIQRAPAGFPARDVKDAIIARRGKQARNIAKVAAARRLLTLVYYGLRDGQIRCLPEPAAAA
ncbi:MAG TPA: IS110 family transposase [Streptosporangiaceae bacterium]|nr:IS110 family transposase [Streptosporangiaceae bacterium]